MYLFFCWLYYISGRADKSRHGTHPRAALRSKSVLLLSCVGGAVKGQSVAVQFIGDSN